MDQKRKVVFFTINLQKKETNHQKSVKLNLLHLQSKSDLACRLCIDTYLAS
jgi:hypothetical protein